MESIHERILNCPISKAADLIDSFSQRNASLWPSSLWPRGEFNQPLSVGAEGSHGGTRYQVSSYSPGRSIEFEFIHPKSYKGFHRFDLLELGPESTLIRHVVNIKARWIDRIMWRVFISWVHDALIEDAFDEAERTAVGSLTKPKKWPVRVYIYRHLLGATRLITGALSSMILKKQATLPTLENLVISPLCNPIIGFQNHVLEETRSRYISFSVEKQPLIAKLLIDVAFKRFTPEVTATWSNEVFQQLVNYGLFVPHTVATKQNLLCYCLNENRRTKLIYQGQCYQITSFVFMAFNNQAPKSFIRETVVLPHWAKTFSEKVYHLLNHPNPQSEIRALSPSLAKRLIKHGLLIHKQDFPDMDSFFSRECILSQTLIQEIPYPNVLPEISLDDLLILNQQVYFLDDIPMDWKNRFYDFKWIQNIQPTIIAEDQVTKILSIHWLDNPQTQLLTSLQKGEISLNDLSHDVRELWTLARILESETSLKKRREEWNRKVQAAYQQVSEKKHMVIEEALSPLDLAITRKYMRHLLNKKYMMLDKANGGTKKRYWQHRENWTFYIHQQMQEFLNQILSEPVKVGHNAITIYQSGAVLPKHKDDVHAFTWVMSLPIDTTPTTARTNAWPLYVETNENPSVVEEAMLGMGDACLVNPQMPHWRDKLEGHSLSILFLWFVPKDFRGFVNGNWIE